MPVDAEARVAVSQGEATAPVLFADHSFAASASQSAPTWRVVTLIRL